MDGLLVLLCGVLGLAIGSFLNVVIWRVPQRMSVVRPPSHCPKCETPIRPLDNIPVVSWMVLQGKCRHCENPIPVRYPLVEAGTGVLFAAVAARFGASWELPAYLFLTAALVAISVIDLDHKMIYDRMTAPVTVSALVLLGLAAAAEGEWSSYGRSVLGGVVFFAFFFLVSFYPSGMGGGDVKLSFSLGLYLGWLGWGEVMLGAFLAFLLGGVIGLVVMVAGGGWKARRKTHIPFGPFLALGVMLAVVWGDPILRWYTGS